MRLKRIVQTYKAPKDWGGGPPGIGDFVRGACHLFELLSGTGIDFKIDVSQTEFFDLIEYDEEVFQIGAPDKIANAETFFVDHNALIRRINEFIASPDSELYVSTNLGAWNRLELPANVQAFIAKFYRFNSVVERLSFEVLRGRAYEVLSIRCGEFDFEHDMYGGQVDAKGRISSIIENHILPSAKFPIVVTSDSYPLKCELAKRYGFLMFPHQSQHGAFGGVLPVALDMLLLRNSRFNYHINAWASWWSGFSHYTSLIFDIPSMNFKAPDFDRTDVGAARLPAGPNLRQLQTEGWTQEAGQDGTGYPDLTRPNVLQETIEGAFKKARTGDLPGAKADCDWLLIEGIRNFYVYYLLGIVSSQQRQWNLARKRLQQAMALSDGIPADRVMDAAARLQEVP